MNDKVDFVRQKLSKLQSRLEQLKDTDYSSVTASDCRMLGDYLRSSSQEEKISILTSMMSLSDTNKANNARIEENFSLSSHLKGKYKELVGSDKELFSSIDKEGEVRYQSNIANIYTSNKYLEEKESQKYISIAQTYLEILSDSAGRPNKALKDALKDKNVIFQIFDTPAMDGKCEYKKINPEDTEKSVVISLSTGCFDDKNIGALGMIMAHEFGHFMDVKDRPEGYQGHLPLGQEMFADAIGYNMSVNAGFNTEKFKSYNKNLGDKINNPILIARSENLQRLQNNQDFFSKTQQNQQVR